MSRPSKRMSPSSRSSSRRDRAGSRLPASCGETPRSRRAGSGRHEACGVRHMKTGASEPRAAHSVVEGIAIGRASLWANDPKPPSAGRSPAEDRTRVQRATECAVRDVEELLRQLPPSEAQLFEPEITILEELTPVIDARVAAG